MSDIQKRLVYALSTLWESHSQAEISVRMISAKAGSSVSAIDYHFGGLEHLFAKAQADAILRAQAWMEQTEAEVASLSGDTLDLSGKACLIASVIDNWARNQRPLAFAWREAHAAARDNSHLLACHQRWNALWSRFWENVSHSLDLSTHAEMIALFCDGEATQHLLSWRTTLDRALLDETVTIFLHFITNTPLPKSHVRIAHRDLANRSYKQAYEREARETPYEDAAAELLREEGLAALTFRAVAKRADTTLGTINYHFGSRSEMVRCALRRLYEKQVSQAVSDLALEQGLPSLELQSLIVARLADGKEPLLRALDEIILYISRAEEHEPMRGVIRNFSDPGGSVILQSLMGNEHEATDGLVAAFSSVCRGYSHAAGALDMEDSLALGHRSLSAFSAKAPRP